MSYSIPATLESVVSSYCTASSFVRLSDSEKDGVVEDLTAIVQRGDGKEWIDREKETFKYPHATELVMSKRL
jgi:hypothetical protein